MSFNLIAISAIATLLAGLVGLAACRAKSPTVAPATQDESAEVAQGESPIQGWVLASPAPNEPPEVVALGSDGEPVSVGVPYNYDWGAINPGLSYDMGEENVEWPEPVRRTSSTIEIRADSSPNWITTFVHVAVNPNSGLPINPDTGEVQELPVYEWSCQGLAGPDACPSAKDGVVRIDSMPDPPMPVEYAAVFAQWSVFPDQVHPDVSQGLDLGFAHGAWLFHFVNE